MKQILILIALTIAGCTGSSNQSSNQSINQECGSSVYFGDVEICLPDIDGMIECYGKPEVKLRADKFEYSGNSILAFYINEASYEYIHRFEEIQLDDYFKIYVVNNMASKTIDEQKLKELSRTMEEGSLAKSRWNELSDKIEDAQDYVSIDRPIFIESYMANKNVSTFILLMKYQNDSGEYIVVAALNMLNIKEKLIGLAYYKVYENVESINKAKAKNDYLVLKLQEENS